MGVDIKRRSMLGAKAALKCEVGKMHGDPKERIREPETPEQIREGLARAW